MGFSSAVNMVGRGVERDALLALLDDPAVRLVTITGRGGVGKTRLAYDAAERLRAQGRTVVEVPLAGIATADLVVSEVAAAVDVPAARSNLADALAARLQHEHVVLLLDNFEHLMPAAPGLSTVVEACHDVQVVVTSQAPLRLRCEHVIALAPFSVDAPTREQRPWCADDDAIALYAQRAAAIDTSFVLDDDNLQVIGELCRRLEGLPLAVELAAARAATLPAAEIVRRLDAVPLDLLRRAYGDAATRHADLRSTIDWTYQLLTLEAQDMLCRLSMLSGAFDLDAVLALSDAMPFATAVDVLASLVDLHLVDPILGIDPARYAMPMSIRMFCHDAMRALGRYDAMRNVRVRARAAQSRAAAAGVESSEEPAWLRMLEADHHDLVTALEVALDAALASEALDLLVGLASVWDARGYHEAHERLAERVLALGELHRDTSVYANALVWSASLGIRHRPEPDRATLIERLHQGEQLARDLADDRTLLRALGAWILVMPRTDGFAKAATASKEAREIAERLHDERWLGAIEAWSGMVAQQSGDDDRAVALGLSAVQRARRSGDRRTLVLATLLLVPLRRHRPEIAPEIPPLTEALRNAREAGLVVYEAALLQIAVTEAVATGDRSEILRWTALSLAVARAMPGSVAVGYNLMTMLPTAVACGDYEAAAYFYGTIRDSISALAQTMAPPQRAAYDATLERARRQLSIEVFDENVRRGARVRPEQAIVDAIAFAERSTRAASLAVAPLGSDERATVSRNELTDRQRAVLRLLTEGLGNKEIATTLQISPKTVMHHTCAIYRTLGVRGRAEAAALAVRDGLID